MALRILVTTFVIALSAIGCNKGTPTSPTPPASSTPPPTTPAPPPAPATATVVGIVTNHHTGQPVGGAAVSVSGGAYNGRSGSTDGNGYFSIPDVAGTFTLQASRAGYNQGSRAVTMNGDTRADFTMVPFWTHSGAGNTVFDMPSYVSRVRIQGEWNRTQTSNFIVRVGGRLVVNEILRDSITYDGTHLVTGGITEIVSSGSIRWTFTQVQ